LDSKECTFKNRNTFVIEKKAGDDFGRIHIANSVCLATRVRIDILRAFAKQFGVEGVEEMYVTAYSSGPILHNCEVSGNQMVSALTFADAVTRFGKRVKMNVWGKHTGGRETHLRPAGATFCGAKGRWYTVPVSAER
jgi:hypothetical protein